MKILLKGFYGFGNFGDDLLMLVFHRMLKEHFPQSDIVVFSNASKNNIDFKAQNNYNHYIKTVLQSNDVDVKIIDWTYKGHFDMVIDGGGGVYFDYSVAGTVKKIINKFVSFFSPESIFSSEKILRKVMHKESRLSFDRRYAIGTNIGPFSTDSKRFLSLYSLLGSVDAFLLRDTESIEYLEHFGHKGFADVISDVVFCPTYLPEISKTNVRTKLKTVGIVIMNWKGQGKAYLAELEMFVKQIEPKGYACRFFAFSELDDASLQEGFTYPITCWKPNEMMISSYLQKLAEVDLMISMRFHGLVVATAMGMPSIGIGINPKIIDFSNQASTCCKLVESDLSAKELEVSFDVVVSNYEKMVQSAIVLREQFGESEAIISSFMENIVKRDDDEV